ncbi:MAG: efflux transporter outer membrane subunit [Pseudomonadota bacterium]
MKSTLTLSSALVICAACVVGPDLAPPDVSTPETFQTTVELAPETSDADWWIGFSDPTLDTLIVDALDNNFQLVAADANLRRTIALLRASESDLLPTLDAFVDTQLSAQFDDNDTDSSASGSTGLAFGFDPDLAGRNKRRIQAAEATMQAAAFQVDDVRRIVAESVALEYVELKQASVRLELLESSLELQDRTLEIVRARFDAGLSPSLDVDRAASDLARTRAQRGRLIADQRDALFALSVLTGRIPSAVLFDEDGPVAIPQLSSTPLVGLPRDILRRRPDLRVAEANFLVELALIGVEEADLYPSIQIPGRLTGRAISSGNPAESLTASLSAVIDLPIFDAGRRRAELEAQRARADSAAANYQSAVLAALVEVESVLARIEALQSQLADLSEAVERSQSAYEQLDALYREGLAGFIDVLDAQRNLISSRESVVDTQADIASATIRLYASLGLSAAPASIESVQN